MNARNVVLDASTSRPSRSSVPCRRRSSASGSENAGTRENLAVVTVVPGAEVPLGVERLAAQRAGRPTGGHHPAGPLDELAGRPRGQPHPQPVQVGRLVLDGLLFLLGL